MDCSSQVKDLGIIFDRVLSLRQPVSYTSVLMIKSLVVLRLDYSNGLFYGLPKCTVSGLQSVKNSAARIVTLERLRDLDSMSPALIGLHWLPVTGGLSISCCCIRIKYCMTWH